MRWFVWFLAAQQALWIDVPFTLQSKDGCGSASIWMIIKYWQPEAAVSVDEIQQQLYSKVAGGIYASDMTRYFESRGYRAFTFRADWSDLENNIAKGRPLIVCLERNSRGVPLHYVVVAGIDPAENLVLVNDPAQRKLLSMTRSEFERSWESTDHWALLALPEVHLATEAFREENLSEARDHLTSALRVNPRDAEANEFLATVYLLQDNPEAALKFWNRTGKPALENIRIDPPLRTDPVLLDRAFAFSRGTVLRLSDYETTQARLSALQVFSRYRMELSPASPASPVSNAKFDLTLRALERDRSGLWSWALGLPFQTIHPEFWNIRGKAINAGSMIRWDPNRRRATLFTEAPLNGNPKWGIRVSADARDEQWLSSMGTFRMRKIEAGARLRSVPSGRWSWTSGASVSSRNFSNLFPDGVELKQSASLTRTLVRDPSRRFTLDSAVSMEAGKMWSVPPARFLKLESETSLGWRWLTAQFRAGRAFGPLPFDESFIMGVDRDSNLWLRGHSATSHGRMNAANAGRSFILANSDAQRTLVQTAWFRIGAGPFLDAARSPNAERWLVDTGIELRFSVLNAVAFHASFGRSLSDHSHAVFVRESALSGGRR